MFGDNFLLYPLEEENRHPMTPLIYTYTYIFFIF